MARLNFQLPEGRRTRPIQWRILSLTAIAVLALALLQDFGGHEQHAPDATKAEEGGRPAFPAGLVEAKSIPAYPIPERLPDDPFQPIAGDKPDDPFAAIAKEAGPQRIPDEEILFQLENSRDFTRDLPIALFYHFLARAKEAGMANLARDARRDVTMAHLFKDNGADSKRYRGQLLGIEGTLVRVVRSDLKPNAYGLTHYYECWIVTRDSAPYPWVAIVAEIPEGMPASTDVHEQVKAAGYYLKLWKYEARDSFRAAPVLFGASLGWTPRGKFRTADAGLNPYLIGAMAAFGSILVFGVFWLKRGDRGYYGGKAASLANRAADFPSTISFDRGAVGVPIAHDDEDDEDANAPWRASLRDDDEDETDFEKREDLTR